MKRGFNRLKELFVNQESLPSIKQIQIWDNKINVLFQDKAEHRRLAKNIWLLMVMNDLNCIAQLAESVGYDAAYVSKILSGSLKVQSKAVCFYGIANKLKMDLDTLLAVDLEKDLQEVIKNHRTPTDN